MFTVEAIVDDLKRLGVKPGDVVMVHASLRKIGPVEGRGEGLVRALDAAVGPAGTLLMVLGAKDDWAWVNERPEDARAALLADAEPFDAATTPAQEDVGVLAEIFRQMAGTLVSNHPEGRFGARGRLARAFMADVPWDDYYGPGSPLARLLDANGKVLRLGADTNTVTLLHYGEYFAAVPNKRRVRRHRRVASPDGPQIRIVDCLDDCDGIVPWDGADYFGLLLTDYLQLGRAATGLVGLATSELVDARDLHAFGVGWMTEHLGG